MNENNFPKDSNGKKTRSFLERLILGSEVVEPQVSGVQDALQKVSTSHYSARNAPALQKVERRIEPTPAFVKKITVADTSNKVLGGKNREPAPPVHPVPFDAEALFVPLQSGTSVAPLSESESKQSSAHVSSSYFDFGNGIAVSSLSGLSEYIQKLTETEFEKTFAQNKERISYWIQVTMANEKLAKLILLADTKEELLTFLRLAAEKP